jgi:hypothetical protein
MTTENPSPFLGMLLTGRPVSAVEEKDNAP